MFDATQWSLVLAAAGMDSKVAQDALSRLCEAYWQPLYAFVRRIGYSPHDAEDATQGFLAGFLQRQAIERVDRSKGRFRSFLIASLKNHLAHERDRDRAVKRGGGRSPLPLDALLAEERYLLEPADPLSPDKLFDRRWALTVLDRAIASLRADYEKTGRLQLFEKLSPALTHASPATHAELGAALGMSEGAVKVAIHRMRRQYRAALRAEVAQTVASLHEVDSELRCLLDALDG